MGLSLSAFVSRYDRKSVDYDGYYGAQCVDLARVWIHNIGGVQFPPLSKGAKDAFRLAQSQFWTKVKNSPSNYPPAGAIVVFDAKPGNAFGHIAIARPGCTKKTLLSFDQNWSLHHACSLEKHNYSSDHVIGWLIKKSAPA